MKLFQNQSYLLIVHYSLGDPDNSAQPGSKVALKTSANFNQQVHGSLITQPGPS